MEKEKKVMVKPLEQILDEMESMIRTVEESAKKAEEAAKEARQAADTAIRVSEDTLKKEEITHRKVSGVKGYLVIFEKGHTNYSAYSPDLPGCVATGKTRIETEKNIKEAINFHLEGLKEDGVALPEPTSFCEYIKI
jgi:predicted RNase H-like HicB family nuclease